MEEYDFIPLSYLHEPLTVAHTACVKERGSNLILKNDYIEMFFLIGQRLSVFTHATFPAIFSGFSHQKAMGLGALEARGQRAFNGSKITEIDL